MKFARLSIIVTVLVFAFTSCKKDKEAYTSDPQPVLAIKLSQPYLGPAQVDSAIAVWRVNNHEQRVKLLLRNDSLLAEMNVFEEGNGDLSITIYSKKKYANQYLGEYEWRKAVSFKKELSFSDDGPVSFFDTDWKPRVLLKDAIGHEALIALRPDDSYFLVKDPGHAIVKLTVDRGYWNTVGGVQFAGGKIWTCVTNCTGQSDSEFFSDLPIRIGTKTWNHIAIYILFSTDANGGWALQLDHNI